MYSKLAKPYVSGQNSGKITVFLYYVLQFSVSNSTHSTLVFFENRKTKFSNEIPDDSFVTIGTAIWAVSKPQCIVLFEVRLKKSIEVFFL